MSEHTPTPWKFSRTHAMSEDRWYVLTDADGRGPIMDVGGCDVAGQIAEAKHLITNERTIEANAALIVRAVNSLASNEAKIEELTAALEWALANCQDSAHPHYPYFANGAWRFPYLINNAGGSGGGVGEASFDTALEAVMAAARRAALSSHTEQEGK
ncbi:MAG: hypothetical protein NT113_13255 [Hyphomicrobiales bacterium]|nr:hypothetical protein [Hyphomicrobiales bacterium]